MRTRHLFSLLPVTSLLFGLGSTASLAALGDEALSEKIPPALVDQPVKLNAPMSVRATAISGNRIRLEWAQPGDEHSGIEVEYSTEAGDGFAQVGIARKGSTQFLKTSLDSDTTYYFRVRTMRAFGDGVVTSPYSEVFTATTLSKRAAAKTAGQKRVVAEKKPAKVVAVKERSAPVETSVTTPAEVSASLPVAEGMSEVTKPADTKEPAVVSEHQAPSVAEITTESHAAANHTDAPADEAAATHSTDIAVVPAPVNAVSN